MSDDGIVNYYVNKCVYMVFQMKLEALMVRFIYFFL